MKKLMIFTMLFILLMTGFSQQEGDYNRFRHSREEYIQTGRDIFDSYKYIDCNEKEIKTDIGINISIFYSDTSSIESKREAMQDLGHTNCEEVIDFYIDVLNNDTSREIRKDALLYLGWLRAKSSIPFLLGATKNNNDLAFVNKIAITLCVMEEFDMAASILDEVCFNEDGSVNRDCIIAYEYAGKTELARNFWLSEWDKHDDDESTFYIALKLTEYGVYDISFPVIKENLLYNTDKWRRHSALSGLAAIATEEALELIQNCTNDNDFVVADYAKFIIAELKKGRRNE